MGRFNTSLVIMLTLAALSYGQTTYADFYIIVNKSNPLTSLNIKEVQKVFLGRQKLFPETNIEPEIIDLPMTDPVLERFYLKATGLTLQKLRRYRAYYLFSGKGKPSTALSNQAAVVDAVEQNPAAIGYLSAAPTNSAVKTLIIIEDSAPNH